MLGLTTYDYLEPTRQDCRRGARRIRQESASFSEPSAAPAQRAAQTSSAEALGFWQSSEQFVPIRARYKHLKLPFGRPGLDDEWS
jgi:hypothetical protein